MCGIVGCILKNNKNAAPVLLDCISKLEYRGYDSIGIATVSDGINIKKDKGEIKEVDSKLDLADMPGHYGIAHVRWATHGDPNKINAHPHTDENESVAVVHNGIIENYTELKEKLLKHGYTFYSQTDTEVVIKLVDYYYKKYNLGPIDAIAKTMVRVRGSYALELMFKDYPGEIWVARKDSPMII